MGAAASKVSRRDQKARAGPGRHGPSRVLGEGARRGDYRLPQPAGKESLHAYRLSGAVSVDSAVALRILVRFLCSTPVVAKSTEKVRATCLVNNSSGPSVYVSRRMIPDRSRPRRFPKNPSDKYEHDFLYF